MAASKGKKVGKQSARQRDFVPGNIPIREWEELLSVEEGVEAVCKLVEELVEKASSVVFDHYLENEAFSYAVQDAKEIILRTLAMEFVGRDDGETDTNMDPTWLQDEAPVPAPIDAWASSMAPLTSRVSLESLKDAVGPIQVQQSPPSSSQTCRSSLTEKRKVGSPSSPIRALLSGSSARRTPTPTKSSLVDRNKVTKTTGRPKARHYRMAVLDRAPSEVSEPVGHDEAEDNGAEERVGESSNSPYAINHTPFGLKLVELRRLKGVTHDESGRIVDMVKLDPAKFPSHRVKPVVSVVQPPKTKPPPSPWRKRTKPTTYSPHVTLPPSPRHYSHDLISKHVKMGIVLKEEGMSQEVVKGDGSGRGDGGMAVSVMPSASGVSCEVSARRFPAIPTLPHLVDTIDPLPGVTVREGNRSIQGPAPDFSSDLSPCKEMRPLPAAGSSEDVDEKRGERRRKKEKFTVDFMLPKTSHPHNNVTRVAS